jgi:hypothetical protein
MYIGPYAGCLIIGYIRLDPPTLLFGKIMISFNLIWGFIKNILSWTLSSHRNYVIYL